jgi:hypothetical protein
MRYGMLPVYRPNPSKSPLTSVVSPTAGLPAGVAQVYAILAVPDGVVVIVPEFDTPVRAARKWSRCCTSAETAFT